MSLIPMHSVVALSAWVAAGSALVPWSQAAEDDFVAAECRTALKAALAQNESLQSRVIAERTANNAMAVKVGILSAEAGEAREEAATLRQRVEATAAPAGVAVLEQRLLDALNDLRLMRQRQLATEERLLRLSEAVSAYLLAGPSEAPAVRTSVEQALAAPLAASAPTAAASPLRIESSQVVSVKPEQRLVVVNAGQRAGLKAGTPLRIYRNDRPLASAVVVEVRANLSGSLVTQLEGDEFPQVGDSLRLLSESQ